MNETGIKVIKKLGDSTNNIETSYTYKDKTCSIIELNSIFAKQCSEVGPIKKDLELVEQALKTAIKISEKLESTLPPNTHHILSDTDPDQHIILWALLTSSITTYYKCFADASGRKIKLSENKLNETLTSEQIAYHKRIKLMRHSWIAHGGANQHDIAKTLLLLDPTAEDQSPKILTILTHTSYVFGPSSLELTDFLDLVVAVIKMTDELRNTKLKLITEREIRSINICTSKTFLVTNFPHSLI